MYRFWVLSKKKKKGRDAAVVAAAKTTFCEGPLPPRARLPLAAAVMETPQGKNP